MKTQVKALKVKIKSLAAEAHIIRREEGKALGKVVASAYVPSGAPGGPKKPKRKDPRRPDPQLYLSLREHRIRDVRKEQRSSLLAYAFIRGKMYEKHEKPRNDNPPDLDRIRKLVEKFGGLPYRPCECSKETLQAWRDGTLKDHPFAVKAETAQPVSAG